jgi:WD40 repeat protein
MNSYYVSITVRVLIVVRIYLPTRPADGRINIWDRESAILLRDLEEPEGHITGVAWNPASDVPMLATGSADGIVSIYC